MAAPGSAPQGPAPRRILIRKGEPIDLALWRETGRTRGGPLEAVLDANPGLAAAPVVPAAPLRALLPAAAQAPTTADVVQLWD